MTFDPTKPCRLSDGRAVRILATDIGESAPIVAVIFGPDGVESIERFRKSGAAWSDADLRLVNAEVLTIAIIRNEFGIGAAPTILPLPGKAPAVLAGHVRVSYTADGELTAEVVQ